MNYKYIEQLLSKYWECKTSAEEEQILRSFFSQDDIPDHLRQYAPLFRLQADESRFTLGTDFDQRMFDVIRREDLSGARTSGLGVLRLIVRQITPLFKAAAVVALLLTVGNVAEKMTVGQDSVGQRSGAEGAYVRQENISAQIKIIDQTHSESSIAKADSLKETTKSTSVGTEQPASKEVIR